MPQNSNFLFTTAMLTARRMRDFLKASEARGSRFQGLGLWMVGKVSKSYWGNIFVDCKIINYLSWEKFLSFSG